MKLAQFFFVVLLSVATSAGTFMLLRGKAMEGGNRTAAQETTAARVLRTGEIRCAYATNPPILIKDPSTGQLGGIFYDLVTEAGQRLGVKIDWVEEVDYGTIAEGFKTDRYDAFCATVWPTPERSRAASFTIPLYYSPADIFIRRDDHRFDNDLSKLNDPAIRFSVRDGDVSDKFAQASFPNAARVGVVQLSSTLQQFDEVAHNKADATISEPALFNRYVAANPNTMRNLTAAHHLLVSPNTIMIKPDQYQFKIMLDTVLQGLLNDGSVEAILAKYDTGGVFLPIAPPYQPERPNTGK